MGQLYYEKWRINNAESMRIESGKGIVTNIKIFGRYYPCEMHITDGSSPPTIRKEFLEDYKWEISEDGNIISPQGLIIVEKNDDSNLEINSDETSQIFKCESVFKEEPTERKQLEKLYKYFGHISPESLYRILKASSARERSNQEDI